MYPLTLIYLVDTTCVPLNVHTAIFRCTVLIFYFSTCLVSVLVSVANGQSSCEDIDPTSCFAMATQNPDMCSDATLATSVCPKFCNRCPLLCYSGTARVDTRMNVLSFHKNTISCNHGEVCMLTRTQPGGSQYMAECADKQKCLHEHADICCTQNLCNSPSNLPPPPTTTTTTARPTTTTARPTTHKPECHKDIIFVVDDSDAMRYSFQYVKALISHLVDKVHIGRTSTLSVYGFSTRPDINLYFREGSVGSNIKHTVTSLNTSPIFQQATNTLGMLMLKQFGMQHSRRGVPNAVVFISASNYRSPIDNQIMLTTLPSLRSTHHNIISVGIGPVDAVFMRLIASDGNHFLHTNYPQLLASTENVNKIYKLICN